MSANSDIQKMMQVQMGQKNLVVSVLLTLFFGGFGLLYSSVILGIVGSIIELVMLILVFATAGIGIILYIPWHLICVILSVVQVNSYNKQLMKKVMGPPRETDNFQKPE